MEELQNTEVMEDVTEEVEAVNEVEEVETEVLPEEDYYVEAQQPEAEQNSMNLKDAAIIAGAVGAGIALKAGYDKWGKPIVQKVGAKWKEARLQHKAKKVAKAEAKAAKAKAKALKEKSELTEVEVTHQDEKSEVTK